MTKKQQVLDSELYKYLGRAKILQYIRYMRDTPRYFVSFMCNMFRSHVMTSNIDAEFDMYWIQEFFNIFRPDNALPEKGNDAFWDDGLENVDKRYAVMNDIIETLEEIEE